MPTSPIILNVTMPVFNRYAITQLTLTALRRSHQHIPFVITVVDNGSEPDLVRKLVEFKEDGIIDNLFLLPRNMGISCAANIGWEMVDAPYYMKFDNDILVKNKNWARDLFNTWKHLDSASTLGPTASMELLQHYSGPIKTPHGVVGVCPISLCGQAILVPKVVSDILGYWNEDYGLYGGEDADYGLRMNCAGMRQYYYNMTEYFTNLGRDDDVDEYRARDINKSEINKHLFRTKDGKIGLYVVNNVLYSLCIRSWKSIKRYEVIDISKKYTVTLRERQEYKTFRSALNLCAEKIGSREFNPLTYKEFMFTNKFVNELKSIMRDAGHSCEDMSLMLGDTVHND